LFPISNGNFDSVTLVVDIGQESLCKRYQTPVDKGISKWQSIAAV